MRRLVPAVALALAVVLAGCTFDAGLPASGDATPEGPADPEFDEIGWEQGYWHDEAVDVDPADGLNDSEFEAVKARTMARVEVVRGLEFPEDVEVEFVTRDELDYAVEPDHWRDAYWEALFVVPGDRQAADAYNEMYDAVVDGYASSTRIVMVVDDTESPHVNVGVLAHELVHALEGQRKTYGSARGHGSFDARQALYAATEGSAMYFERRYLERCDTEWGCIDAPVTAGAPPGSGEINEGLYLDFALRYTVGEQFVAAIADRGGLDAVESMQTRPPASTAQVIHPETYPDDEPEAVPVEDRTGGGWERRPRYGEEQDWLTVGEGRLYAMLWYNGVVDENRTANVTVSQQVDTDYVHPATDGWAGDRFVPYFDSDRTGFVYRSAWDTGRDAREFRDAYVELLGANGAERVAPGRFVIESGDYAGAYRVAVTNDTVTVVNAPTVDELDAVHALDAPADNATRTADATAAADATRVAGGSA